MKAISVTFLRKERERRKESAFPSLLFGTINLAFAASCTRVATIPFHVHCAYRFILLTCAQSIIDARIS